MLLTALALLLQIISYLIIILIYLISISPKQINGLDIHNQATMKRITFIVLANIIIAYEKLQQVARQDLLQGREPRPRAEPPQARAREAAGPGQRGAGRHLQVQPRGRAGQGLQQQGLQGR